MSSPSVRPCPEPTESSPWTERLLILGECSNGTPASFAVSDILESGGHWQEL